MPVLWSNPTEGLGILPAQAPFPGQTVDPRLALAIGAQRQQQQQQAQQAMQQVSQAIAAYGEQRQRDRIANTLLAAQQTGQPVTPEALKAASATGPGGFGGPPVQNLGGAATYNAYQQQLDAQAKRDAQTIHSQYLSSEIHKNLYGTPSQGGNQALVDVDLGGGNVLSGIPLSQANALAGHHTAIGKQQQAQIDKEYDETLKKQTGGYGLSTFKNISTTEPYSAGNPRTVMYTSDPQGKTQVFGDNPDLVAHPEKYYASFATTPTGKSFATMPLNKYFDTQKTLDEYQQKRNSVSGQAITVTPHAGGGVGGGGNTAALAQANAIKSDFKAGKLTPDEARAKLSALGIFQ